MARSRSRSRRPALLAGGALRVRRGGRPARASAGVVVEDLHTRTGDRAARQGRASTATASSRRSTPPPGAAACWSACRPGVDAGAPDPAALSWPARRSTVPRVLVVAGAGSSFEIIEGHVGRRRATGQVLGVTEIFVGSGANVRYGLVQRWEPGVIGHLTARARVGAGARFQLSLASFGGSTLQGRRRRDPRRRGRRGRDRSASPWAATQQHFDHHTEHIHEAGKTRSNLDFKVALTDARALRLHRDDPNRAGTPAAARRTRRTATCCSPTTRAPSRSPSSRSSPTTCAARTAPPWRRSTPSSSSTCRAAACRTCQAMRADRLRLPRTRPWHGCPQTTRERIEALVAARLHAE